ncbi:MAG: hypothetical protein ACE37B_17260 [Ilumatobacter sp.]|uniref:hypothetical protein n=1 Tax=Ilumatobacter sp. TaxID=1967498 RepID=UPI00391C9ABD
MGKDGTAFSPRLRAPSVLRIFIVSTVAFLLSGIPGYAILLPSCGTVNVMQYSFYTHYISQPITSYDCRHGHKHGNFGGAYSNMLFEYGGLNSSVPCHRISTRVHYASGGGVFPGSTDYEYSVGNWASSTAPGNTGVFASDIATQRIGSWYDSGHVRLSGLTC